MLGNGALAFRIVTILTLYLLVPANLYRILFLIRVSPLQQIRCYLFVVVVSTGFRNLSSVSMLFAHSFLTSMLVIASVVLSFATCGGRRF